VAEAVKTGKLADVNRLCTQWAKAEPSNDRPRIQLGRALMNVGLPDRALEQFELAAEANSLSAEPRCEMGSLFIKRDKLEMAADEFGQALRIDPKSVSALLGNARVKLLKDDPGAALAGARRALDAEPNSVPARVLAGECLLVLFRAGEALTQFQGAVKSEPDNADALFGLARACELNREPLAAQQHWERFVEIEPSGDRAVAVRNGWVVVQTRIVCKSGGRTPCGATWSPDGRQVAFLSSYRELLAVPLAEGRPKARTVATASDMLAHATWSPDGKHIAMLAKQKLWTVGVVPSDGSGELRALSPAHGVCWSPEQAGLLFFDTIARGFRSLTLAGAESEEPILPSRVRDADGALWEFYHSHVAPSGRAAACGARLVPSHARFELFVRNLRGAGDCRRLTRTEAYNGMARFSPDGTGIAYVSSARGKFDVWVVAADGSAGPVMLARCDDAGGLTPQPDWAPDGRAVAYGTRQGIFIAELGGLDPRPVRIAASRQGRALRVTVTSQTDEAQRIDLRWEAFDPQSFRIALGRAGDEPLALKPGGEAERTFEMSPETSGKARTVKVRALNDDGVGAVVLIDWRT